MTKLGDRARQLCRIALGVFLGVLCVVGLSPRSAFAQDQAAQADDAGDVESEVIVTAFRKSLAVSLDQKRDAAGAVDVIVAEDIADFPDLNLAESLQRIPGVAIERDAGEGRKISVRGLGSQYTRVRINGMEAMSANGGTDAAGGTNRNRQFDFNTFASELFNSLTVHKTSAAEIEEGSLGATVDLLVARPFDYDRFTFATSAQLGYNDLGEDLDPRGALLISNTFADGRFGALLSAAYTERKLLDEGASTVRWQSGGAFQSVPAGFDPADVSGAFRPRIPRYDIYNHEQERLGLTGSLQFQPAESTLFTLDGMFAKFDAQRSEVFLESPNFSASLSAVDVLDAEIRQDGVDGDGDPLSTLVYGVFDDVDIRTEQRYDELTTEFTQFTLEGTHEFAGGVQLRGFAGWSESKHDNPIQTTLLWDIADVDGYSFDYRGDSRLPLISYGNADVQNPEAWTLTQIRLRPQTSDNEFMNYAFDVRWALTDAFALKAGVQLKEYEFATSDRRRANGEGDVANQVGTPRSDYAEFAELGGDLGFPSGTTTRWAIPALDRAAELFNLYDEAAFPLSIQPALGGNFGVEEEDAGAFVQAEFDTDAPGFTLRGNIGLRYVETTQTSTGWTRGAVSTTLTTVEHDYSDTLPSLNLVAEVTDDFLVRVGASKVMARAGLAQLNPGANVTISGNNKTVAAGNPLLEPFRADAYDLSLEWYFADEALLGAAFFYKDVESFVQTIRATGPFSDNPLGFEDSVAIGACTGSIGGFDPNDPAQVAACLDGWQFSLPRNTPGGVVKGFELSYQQPFSFLPAPFNNFGAIINYTAVESEILYLNADGTAAFNGERQDLTDLSKNAYNATLYFENERFGARVSAAYRDEFLTTAPGRNGNNVEGTADTLTIDAAASLTLTDNIELTLEALNLTDEFQDQWVDSTADRLSYYHHQGRQYFLGARFRF